MDHLKSCCPQCDNDEAWHIAKTIMEFYAGESRRTDEIAELIRNEVERWRVRYGGATAEITRLRRKVELGDALALAIRHVVSEPCGEPVVASDGMTQYCDNCALCNLRMAYRAYEEQFDA